MAFSKTISRTTKFAVIFVVIVAQVIANSIPSDLPSEDKWPVDAQNSIKESIFKAQLHGLENEKVKAIANHAFDTFAKFVELSLVNTIEKVKNITTDEDIPLLQTQLVKWTEGLERLNNVSDSTDKTPRKALEKFLITIDFIVKEVIGFDKNYNFKSLESKQVVEEIKLLVKESVIMLDEYAKSVEEQIAGMSETI